MTRGALALFTALLLAAAEAQQTQAASSPGGVCADRDVHIEIENVGGAVADALDTEGDNSVLTNACFVRSKIAIETPSLKTVNGVSDARQVRLRGQTLDGSADGLQADSQGTRFTNLKARLDLPNPAFPGIAVPAGTYDLVSPQLTIAGDNGEGFKTAELTLTNVNDKTVTRLVGTSSTSQLLTADAVTLGRVNAAQTRVVPGRIQARQAQIGLCRDPQARGLVLNAGSLNATSSGTRIEDGTLQVGALRLPVGGTVNATASGDTVNATLQTFQDSSGALISSVQNNPPVLVLDSGYFGLRNIPLLDANDTRVNVVYHTTFPEINFTTNWQGAVIRAGIFDDYDSDLGTHTPESQFSVTHLNNDGFQYLAALRADPYLSEARVGYAKTFGPLVVRLDGGGGYQNGVSAVILHTRAVLSKDVQVARGFSVGGTLIGDALYFPYVTGVSATSARQLYVEGQLRASYTGGPFSVSASHTSRVVDGASPLLNPNAGMNNDNLLMTGTQTTSGAVSLNLAPGSAARVRLNTANAAATYDWSSATLSSATVGISARAESDWGLIVPRVQYDFVKQTPIVGSDVQLYSDCFAYGVTFDYTFPYTLAGVTYDSGAFKVALKLNFR